VAVYYIFVNYPFFTRMTGIFGNRWFGVDPIASGAFGVPPDSRRRSWSA
jgi:cation/acetate symporter